MGSLLSSCAGGTAGTSSGSQVAPVVRVAVAPQAVTVPTSGTAQFVATVENLPGASIQWEVNRVPGGDGTLGTIDSTGLYQAPANVPGTSVEITAVLQTDTSRFGSADVTVVAPVSVSPWQAAVAAWQTIQFQAAGPAVGGAGVFWSASGGTITPAGLYTPPGAGIFTVTATSSTDPSASAVAIVYATDYAGQSSWRNDLGLTGQNRQELALSPATLAAGSFGRVSSCAVDGQVHAQPLYASNVFAGGRARNVIYIATERNAVYAFDADAIPCEQVWKRSLADEDAQPVPASDILGGDIFSDAGIFGTPVVDRASGTLYLVAKSKEEGPFGPVHVQRLHALDIATGSEKFGGPIAIEANAPGRGDGNNGSDHVIFDAAAADQRAALQLIGGRLYVAFTGHDQGGGFHGWLLAYDPGTLAQLDAFNSTPDRSKGGIIAAPSSDTVGNIYVAPGQGSFGMSTFPPFRWNFGQTLLKLSPPPLTIADLSKDTFTPFNESLLSLAQEDFGATGALIVPDQAGAPNSRLAIVGATNGALYVLNRDNLGGYTPSGPDQVIQTLALPGGLYGTPAYWRNTVYVAAAGDALKAYPLAGGALSGAPSSQSGSTIAAPGASPVISSSGDNNGIVWLLDTSGADSTPRAPAVLRAFAATDLSRELYNSSRKAEDAAGPASRLAVPTIANGRVFVGTQNELTVYGLAP